ncbi:MAG: phosphate/phosphite/phosphonate ABC transporter substrate-binding protein [Gammaproteobacteria bacterium]|nr:phosphate/phosphite/phosphonate ABC transporter substrate-binding protein [Gammaproteobacteria bacterium]
MQMRWRGSFSFFFGLFFCALAGSAEASPAGQPTFAFRLGVIAEKADRPAETLRQYSALQAYFNAQSGRRDLRIELVVARDIPEMISQFAQATVDAVLESVMPVLIIERHSSALEPVLLAWRDGLRQYQSLFFVRQDSSINALNDLQGHTLAFASDRSSAAFLVPLAVLREAGMSVRPTADTLASASAVRYVFAGRELNQAYWVQRGRVDAGAFKDSDWEQVPWVVRKDLRVIAQTPALPNWLLAFRSDLDPRIVQAIGRILLDMHKDTTGQDALRAAGHITKFELLQDTDLAAVDYWRQRLKYVDSVP